MSPEDPQFDVGSNPQAVPWTEYVRFYTGANGSGEAQTSGSGGGVELPEPPSREELARMAAAQLQINAQDSIEETRRRIIRWLRVERGLAWGPAFAELSSMEQQWAGTLRGKQLTSWQRAQLDYMRESPLGDYNDWACRQGNRWCENLKRDAAKAEKKRSKARGTQSASVASSKAKSAPLSQGAIWVLVGISVISLVFSISAIMWVINKLFR